MSDTKPRVRTAWTDPDHMRLVHDLAERMNERRAQRSRTPDPHDPWAVPPGEHPEVALADTLFAFGWTLLADRPEHAGHGGWTFDTRDGAYICGCGCPMFRLAPVAEAVA